MRTFASRKIDGDLTVVATRSFPVNNFLNAFTYALLVLFFMGIKDAHAQCSTGINETYVIINSGFGNNYYNLQSSSAAYTFQSANLGTFCPGSGSGAGTLILNGGQNKVYKCNGGDIWQNQIWYRIYSTSASPTGSFSPLTMYYSSGNGNGCGGQDQVWQVDNANVNVLSGLSPDTYYLEVYSTADYQNCGSGTWYASNSGYNYRATFTVAAPPTPTVNSDTICEGQTDTLRVSGVPGYSMYVWSVGGMGINGPSIAVTAEGKYTVTVTEPGNGCVAATSGIVTFSQIKPTVNDVFICTGGNAIMTVTDGTSYIWNTGAITSSITVSTEGTYTVTVTNGKGCTATASGNASVNYPIINNITIPQGASSMWLYAADIPGASYIWNTGASSQSILVDSPGVYTVTVSTGDGCPTIVIDTVTTYVPSDMGGDFFSSILIAGGNSDLLTFGGNMGMARSKKGVSLYMSADTLNNKGDSSLAQLSLLIEDASIPFVIGLTSSDIGKVSDITISEGSPLHVSDNIPFYLFSPGNGVIYSYYNYKYDIVTKAADQFVNNGDMLSLFGYNGKYEFRQAHITASGGGGSFRSFYFAPNLDMSPKAICEVGSVDPEAVLVYNGSMIVQGPLIEEAYNLSDNFYIDATNVGFIFGNNYQNLTGKTDGGNTPIIFNDGGGVNLNDQGDFAPYNYSFPDGSQGGPGSYWNEPSDDGTYDIVLTDVNNNVSHRFIEFGENVYWDGIYNAINPNRNFGIIQLAGPPQYGNGTNRFVAGANVISAGTSGYVDYQISTQEINLQNDASLLYLGLSPPGVFDPGSIPSGFYVALDKHLSPTFKTSGSNFTGTISYESLLGSLRPGSHVIRLEKSGTTLTAYLNGMPMGSMNIPGDVDLRPVIIAKYGGSGMDESVLIPQAFTNASTLDNCTNVLAATDVSYTSSAIDFNGLGNAVIHVDSPGISYSWVDSPSFSITDMSALVTKVQSSKKDEMALLSSLYPGVIEPIDTFPPNPPIYREFKAPLEGIYNLIIQDNNKKCFAQNMDINIGTNIRMLTSTDMPSLSIAQMNEVLQVPISISPYLNVTIQAFVQDVTNRSFCVSSRPVSDDENATLYVQSDIEMGTISLGFMKIDSPSVSIIAKVGDTIVGDTTMYDYRIFVTASESGDYSISAGPRVNVFGNINAWSDNPIIVIKIGDFLLFLQDDVFAYAQWPKGKGGLYAGATMHTGTLLSTLIAYKQSFQLVKP